MSARKLRLYHRLQRAAHAVRKGADRAVAQAAGLTTAQAAVLTVVAAGTDVTQRDVAAALGLNESAITAMTVRLLKLGFLERARSGTDTRAWRLLLTPAGETALRTSRQAFAAVNALFDREFSTTELERLGDVLLRLTRAFSEYPPTYR